MVGAHTSQISAEPLQELGIGYADLNGNLLLAHKNIYVDVVRPRRHIRIPKVSNVFSPAGLAALQGCACQSIQAIPVGGNRFRNRLSVAKSFKSQNGFMRMDSWSECRRPMLTKPRQLLKLFTKELRTDFLEKRRYSGDSTKCRRADGRELTRLCEKRRIRCALTLSSGLEPYERNLREEVTAAYIDVDAEEIRNDLRLEAVERGANVLLMNRRRLTTRSRRDLLQNPQIGKRHGKCKPYSVVPDFSLQGGPARSRRNS